jgi:hypothetical protein
MATLAPSPVCTVQLPADLYNDVRAFLSESQKVDAAAIDSFVEAAVSNYLIRRASKLVHAATQHLSEEELADFVSESMEWARLQK